MATRVEPDAIRLVEALARWRSGDRDGALDAGVMAADPAGTALTGVDQAELLAVQARVRAAWEARERYRQRCLRLALREAERLQRSTLAIEPQSGAGPALPPAAAAALARAKARAKARAGLPG